VSEDLSDKGVRFNLVFVGILREGDFLDGYEIMFLISFVMAEAHGGYRIADRYTGWRVFE